MVGLNNNTFKVGDEIWDDVRIVPGAFSFGGNSDPNLIQWQPGGSGADFRVYAFRLNDEAFALVQMPHTYLEGSDLKFHLHWTPQARGVVESGNSVGWKVDYSVANVNDNFPASFTVDLSDVCDGVNDKHQVASSVTVSGTGLKVSHMILLRIYRTDTGTDDTWAGGSANNSPVLLEFDIHFQKDGAGSNLEFSKTI